MMQDYLSITPEIEEAIKAGKPVVALESTILSHGMPFPQNMEFAHKVEEIVRAEGSNTRHNSHNRQENSR